MTDPQRRAVEAIDSWFKSSYKNLGYGNEILARVRAADLVIVNRADVAAAVRFAEVHSPRYNRDYEFMQHFREELDDDI